MNLVKNRWVIFVVLLSIFPPDVITEFTFVKNSLNFLQVVFTLYLIIYYAGKKTFPNVLMPMILYLLVIFFSGLYNGRELTPSIIFVVNQLGFLLFIETGIRKNLKKFVNGVYIYFSTICYINYIYLLIGYYKFGIAINDSLFITVSNSITAFLLFAIAIAVLDSYLKGKKLTKSALILILCISHTEILVWSGTGLMGWFIIIVYLLLIYQRRYEKKINFLALNIISIILFLGIVIFRIQDIFSYIIQDVLGKDLTFTGRTVIWDFYIDQIKKSIIIGYGFGYRPYKDLFSHCGYLEIMVQGGLLLMSVFLITILKVTKKLAECKNNSISNFFGIFIFSFEIMMLTEFPNVVLLFGIMIFSFYVNQIIEQCNPKLNYNMGIIK